MRQTTSRVIDRITETMAVLALLAIFGIALLLLLDIWSRTARNYSMPGVYDSVTLLLVVAVFAALPYAEKNRSHVKISLLVDKMPARVAKAMRVSGSLITLAMLIWISVATAQQAMHSINIDEAKLGVVDVPVWPIRIFIVVGVLALLLETIRTVVHQVQPPGGIQIEEKLRVGESANNVEKGGLR